MSQRSIHWIWKVLSDEDKQSLHFRLQEVRKNKKNFGLSGQKSTPNPHRLWEELQASQN